MNANSDRHEIFRQGQAANDNNRRVYRTKKGECQWNPYPVGTDERKAWDEGYSYRDMVNDG